MFGFLRALFGGMPKPAGPPRRIATIDSYTQLISEQAGWDRDALSADSASKGTIRLCEMQLDGSKFEQCMLGLRFQFSSRGHDVNVYPEIWVTVEGMGEFFSKGLKFRLKGTNDWTSCELPFYLRAGQRAKMLKLNLIFDRAGSASLKQIELYSTPLES